MSIIEKWTQKRASLSKSNPNLSECPAVLASELNSLKNIRGTSIRQTSQSYQAKRKKSLGITMPSWKKAILNFMKALNPVDQPTQKSAGLTILPNAAPSVRKSKKRGSPN